ncbi:MAG: sigma-70 family RNA polymerase sigma factor [Planctomycetota bacterium]
MGEFTEILNEAVEGDPSAVSRLAPLVSEQLRAIAAAHMNRERDGHTLQPTALVHEAYVRLSGEKQVVWKSRGQFLAIASRCMRQVLVNHANARKAAKRGGGVAIGSLEPGLTPAADNGVDVLSLEEALSRLEAESPRHARVVECRFFGGMSVQETADAVGVSPRTVESDWRFAKAWLRKELS